MSEEEAKKVLKNMDINENGATCNGCIFGNDTPCLRNGKNCQIIAIDTVLQLLEQKDNKINKVIDKLKEELNYCSTSKNQYDKCALQCKFYEKLLKILEE